MKEWGRKGGGGGGRKDRVQGGWGRIHMRSCGTKGAAVGNVVLGLGVALPGACVEGTSR